MNRKKKENIFFLWKKGKFSFLAKKKKVFWNNKRLLYIDTFF